jgi:hypothetical protein
MKRRRVLAVAGAASMGALSGCAAVADLLGDDEEDTSTPSGSSSQDDSSTPSQSEPGSDLDADASIIVFDQSPLEGYAISVDITVGNADEVRVLHNGREVATYEDSGQYKIAGHTDDEQAVMDVSAVEELDTFTVVAVYDSGDIVQELDKRLAD